MIAPQEVLARAATVAAEDARSCSRHFVDLLADEFAAQMSECVDAVLAWAADRDDPRARDWIERRARRRAREGFSAADAVCGFAAVRRALRQELAGRDDVDADLAARVELAVDEVEESFVAALERLRGSEPAPLLAELVREAQEALPQPVVLFDVGGRAVWATQAFASMCERPSAEIVGQPASELMPVAARGFAHPEAVERSLRRSSARPEQPHSDVFQTRSGAWLARTSLPLGRDRYRGRLVAFTDVSEFVEAQRRAQQLSDALVHAQERERAHIASELHDGPVQLLAAALLRLDPALAGPPGAKTEGLLEQLRSDLRLAYAEIRSLLFNLRPEVLAQQGLGAAARELAARFEDETGISARVENERVSEKRDEQAVVAFRVLQEAFSNVRKHADARNVHVVLEGDGDLSVTIRDDGRGFSVEEARDRVHVGHIGLATMRERVELAGGRFVLESGPGDGTRISIWLPESSP